MSLHHLPARSTGPLTSWEAAEKLESSGKGAHQRAIALTAVELHPGLTSYELARHCRLDRFQLARRLPEVERTKLIRRGEKRVCSVTGMSAMTWWPVETGEQLALVA